MATAENSTLDFQGIFFLFISDHKTPQPKNKKFKAYMCENWPAKVESVLPPHMEFPSFKITPEAITAANTGPGNRKDINRNPAQTERGRVTTGIRVPILKAIPMGIR